jgi:transketolase
MAEIMSVLFFNVMKYDRKQPKHPANDRFILSKGHAAPILYAGESKSKLYSSLVGGT